MRNASSKKVAVSYRRATNGSTWRLRLLTASAKPSHFESKRSHRASNSVFGFDCFVLAQSTWIIQFINLNLKL